jgi:hypothetical protein
MMRCFVVLNCIRVRIRKCEADHNVSLRKEEKEENYIAWRAVSCCIVLLNSKMLKCFDVEVLRCRRGEYLDAEAYLC